MATLRIKQNIAALNTENHEEHLRGNQVRDTSVPRSQEDYITQVSEEIKGRVTMKLSQEFSEMERRILGALYRLDEFLLNPLIQGHAGSALETSRKAYGINQWTNEDDFQSDLHPKAGVSQSQSTQNSGPDDGYDI